MVLTIFEQLFSVTKCLTLYMDSHFKPSSQLYSKRRNLNRQSLHLTVFAAQEFLSTL